MLHIPRPFQARSTVLFSKPLRGKVGTSGKASNVWRIPNYAQNTRRNGSIVGASHRTIDNPWECNARAHRSPTVFLRQGHVAMFDTAIQSVMAHRNSLNLTVHIWLSFGGFIRQHGQPFRCPGDFPLLRSMSRHRPVPDSPELQELKFQASMILNRSTRSRTSFDVRSWSLRLQLQCQ